jgi:hypothetical protein
MNTTIRRAIFLDFDGVLFDTVREAYAVTMIALGRFDRLVDVDFDTSHFKNFSRFRYLIGPAWNYYYLVQSIDRQIEEPTIDIEIEFKKFLEMWVEREIQPFGENFFQTRIRLRVKEREQWSSLILPYDFLENIRKLSREFRRRFFLVTTRDRESVLDILKLYDLQIIDSNIFAKNEYTVHISKLSIIRDLIKERQIEESVFIDDLEEHFMSSEAIQSLTTLQAKWGYVVPQKKEDNSRLLFKELKKFLHGENVWV